MNPSRASFWASFFITVGAGINIPLLVERWPALLSMALLLILIKGVILFGLGTIFHLRGRDRWLFSLALAQGGEFGFVLIAFSVAQGVLPQDTSETLLLVIALTMLITPLLFILYEMISRRTSEAQDTRPDDDIDESGPVIIAGIGRFGQIVNRLVQASGFKTVVLDNDYEKIALMRRFGYKGFLGDPTRSDLLEAAGLATASILVVAVDDRKAAISLVSYARKQRPDLHIIARAHDRLEVYKLYQAGANDIVREMFDASLRAGRYVLENLGLSEFEAARAQEIFYQHDRHAVRELAQLWDPETRPSDNKAYIQKAKELEQDLEFALSSLTEDEQKRA